MFRAILTALTLCAGLILSGCGQSGPLYLPGNPSQMTIPGPEQDAPVEEEENTEANEESGGETR